MTKLSRAQAKQFYATILLLRLSVAERNDQLLDSNQEDDRFEKIVDPSDPAYNPEIVETLCVGLQGVRNEFLERKIAESTGSLVNVIGPIEEMFPCPCCGHLTLTKLAEYDICLVCWWEDDGFDEHLYSGPNHSTLIDYRSDFEAKRGKLLAEGNPADIEIFEKYPHANESH